MKRCAAVLALCVPALHAQNTVVVVDAAGGPGVQYTDLQTALDLEPEGSILLLRSGAAGISIDRGVCLFADPSPGVPAVLSSLTVSTTSATRGSLLRGLTMFGLDVDGQNELPIWIEDTSIIAGTELHGPSSVTLTRSSVRAIASCGPAIEAFGAPLNIYDSTLEGVTPCGLGQPTPALRVEGSPAVLIAGSTLTGGDAATPSGSGGHALDVTDSEVWLQEAVLAPGIGGGEPIAESGVTWHTNTAGRRSLEIPATFREDSVLTERFFGAPGDFALLAFSFDQAPVGPILPEFFGPLHIDGGSRVFFKGTVPTSGELTSIVPLTPMGLGHNGIVVYMQAAFVTPFGEVLFSNPTAGLLLGVLVD